MSGPEGTIRLVKEGVISLSVTTRFHPFHTSPHYCTDTQFRSSLFFCLTNFAAISSHFEKENKKGKPNHIGGP